MPPPRTRSSVPRRTFAFHAANVLALALVQLCAIPGASASQWTYQPAICGSQSCASAAPTLAPWQKDVRALQALWRDCGNAYIQMFLAMKGSIWTDVFLFDGTQAEWTALCSDGAAEIRCTAEGRVWHLAPNADDLNLGCPKGLPIAPELEDLTEVTEVAMSGIFGSWSPNLDVNDVAASLVTLQKLRRLDLSDNALVGELHRSTAAAVQIESLFLNDNGLTALDLGGFVALEEIHLADNQLRGPLPDDWSILKNLKILEAPRNPKLAASSLPAAWFAADGMTALETLDLSSCSLTGTLPNGVGNLGDLKLKSIKLADNDFHGPAPPNLLTAEDDLEHVDLHNNNLTGPMPAGSSAGFTALKEMNLAENKMTGSPPMFTNAQLLLTYDVSDNALDGVVPDMCGSPGITYLFLYKNKLTGALPNLSCMTSLYEVDVSGNGLTSLEGDWLGGSPKLQHFNAERNQLTGAPPTSLCGAYSRTLYLGHNAWRGSIPESIGDCPELEVLDFTVDEASVDDGSAAGTMPSSAAFAKLTKLTTLALSGLGMEGTLPASVFALEKLETLDLSHNKLSGSVSEVPVGALSNLRKISLAGNQITGVVPLSLLTLQKLTSVDVSDNMITGVEEPAVLADVDWLAIDTLNLADNQLTAFPTVLRRAAALKTLDLTRNAVAGSVPQWLCQHSALHHLYLGDNELTGAVHEWLTVDAADVSELRVLTLDDNPGVHGPGRDWPGLQKLTALEFLHLANTGSFGEFPSLPLLPELTVFHAPNAGLFGTLNASLFESAPALRRLDLSGNSLSGPIPASLSTHAALTNLYLRDNDFDGTFPHLPMHVLAKEEASGGTGVDFTGAGRFKCPVPGADAAYSTVSCECGPGAAGVNGGRLSCVSCLPGTFTPDVGAESCATCAAGSFVAGHGAVECGECDAGFYSTGGAAACTACPLGQFVNASGSSSCDACAAGTYTPVEGTTRCVECEPGSFSGLGAASCESCPAGSFAGGAGSTSCTLCVAGTFQGVVGRDVCDACPQGSANDAEGSGTCAPCARGTFASDAGLTRCESCEPGTYQNKTGKASCVDCPAGTQNPLAASDDASACVACPAGTHSGVKSTECVTCPAETFSASENAAVCEECPMNSSPADGKTRCACDPGHVETASSSFTCEPCAPGWFAEAADSKFCDLCGGDGYAAKNGTEACTPFSPGHVGDDFENDKRMFGAKTQVPCSPGTRARDMLVALAIVRTCERCPNGTISAAAADDCVSCDLGSRSSVDNTRCVEVVNAPGSGLDGDGGSSTNATDEYNNLLASYVAAARDNAKTPATAVGFFILLGVVATCCGLFTGWYRRRRIRLRQLALEREYLIEEAESDMQRGKPPRRATIYALAGVDAERTELGGDGEDIDDMMLTGRRGRRKSSAFLDVARGRTRMFGNGGHVSRQRDATRDRRGSNTSSNALYKAARRASRFGGGGGGGGRRRRRRGYDQVSDDDDFSDGELTDHFDEDEDDEDGFEFDESSEDDEERGRGRGRGRGRFARPRPPAPESDASGSSKKATKSWWKKVTRGTGTTRRGGTKGGGGGMARRPSLPYHPTDEDPRSVAEVVVEARR